MPARLAAHLPGVDQAARDKLFGSITDVMALPFGDPTREGAIAGASPSLSLSPLLPSLLPPSFSPPPPYPHLPFPPCSPAWY